MNYYILLGIPEDADEETTRRAFRALVRRYHPDVGAGSSPEKFREIVDAYETLRDPVRRASYDSSLRTARISGRQASSEPIWAEPTRVEPLVESLGVRFPYRAHYSGEPLFMVDVFAYRFEQLFAEMLDDGFADFFGRLF
jgi:curved DNA-binding protein CbpA